MQANFVGEQAEAWSQARPDDRLTMLAPHDDLARQHEQHDQIAIQRFRYFLPAKWQRLAYPAILPNIKRNPALVFQLPFFLMAQYFAAARIVRRRPTGLVYSHWVMPQGLIAWCLKKRFGIPYVLQNHSSDLAVFEKLGPLGRKLARKLLRDSNHFFCVNSLQRDYAAGLFDGEERERFLERCSVLPMGVDLPLAAQVAAPSYDIATIGRLSAKKGIHFLIEAGERMAAQGKRPVIGIAGDGEEASVLKQMARSADVRFLGFMDGVAKIQFFDRVARFAFPAKKVDGDVEGLPVSLLEALCRGMPVLATRDTNIELLPEWPQLQNHVVFVADPSDAAAMEAGLGQLLDRPPEIDRELINLMSHYRWDNLINDYLAPIDVSLAN